MPTWNSSNVRSSKNQGRRPAPRQRPDRDGHPARAGVRADLTSAAAIRRRRSAPSRRRRTAGLERSTRRRTAAVGRSLSRAVGEVIGSLGHVLVDHALSFGEVAALDGIDDRLMPSPDIIRGARSGPPFMIATRILPSRCRHASTSIELPARRQSSRWNEVGFDPFDKAEFGAGKLSQRLAQVVAAAVPPPARR